ncbi:hypothetical protein EV359DRAFT_65743 [Lentinula novae-zelandiae]|nr:hypothetical protein EV359DRAFT_65743 [Lentinula novae-zelandiae]
MGNPQNSIIQDGSYFRDGNMMLYNVRLVPGKGKPKPMPVTFVGRVLSSANNTGMLGNYVASKSDPKYGKRTAFLGRPFDEDLITLLSKEQGINVAYLWQDDDVVTNDGTFRFGHPLFRALKPNEQKDSKIPPIVPKGKETSSFWMRAVDGFALAKFPAVDINGKSIPNEDVQSVIEGATVAIDAVMRGWKFKTDKRWGFALDIKRLTVLHVAEEEQELELPSLPGSQGTVSTDDEKLNIDCLPRTEGDGTVALGENLGGDTAATTEVAHAVTEDVRKARTGKAPTTPVSNKRRGPPLAKPSGEKQATLTPDQLVVFHAVTAHVEAYLEGQKTEQLLCCCSDDIVFKGAATPHSASLIGGISVETLPPEAAVNDKQQYFLLDCGNGLDMNSLRRATAQTYYVTAFEIVLFPKLTGTLSTPMFCHLKLLRVILHPINRLLSRLHGPGRSSGVPTSLESLQLIYTKCLHDIVLDSREMVPALRPDVVQLRYPPKEITVYLAPELLHWNPNLDEVLHIKPVTTRYNLPPVFPSMAEGDITRTQIPIAPLFAALEHEVAGQHFTSILIDMKDGLKEFSNLYSVLSRVETGGQCWITEQAKFERFEVYSPIVPLTLYASEVLCNPAGIVIEILRAPSLQRRIVRDPGAAHSAQKLSKIHARNSFEGVAGSKRSIFLYLCHGLSKLKTVVFLVKRKRVVAKVQFPTFTTSSQWICLISPGYNSWGKMSLKGICLTKAMEVASMLVIYLKRGHCVRLAAQGYNIPVWFALNQEIQKDIAISMLAGISVSFSDRIVEDSESFHGGKREDSWTLFTIGGEGGNGTVPSQSH